MMAVQIVTSNEIDYFDVIILDINMPIMNGLQACKKISSKKSNREPNIILNIS